VQHVVATSEFGIVSRRTIDMRATTDHPGLLVTLALVAPLPTTPADIRAAAAAAPRAAHLATSPSHPNCRGGPLRMPDDRHLLEERRP
jgi:hypothetical protein